MLGLFEVDGETAHYLGCLVLQSQDSKLFLIIDGQHSLSHLKELEAAGRLGFRQEQTPQ